MDNQKSGDNEIEDAPEDNTEETNTSEPTKKENDEQDETNEENDNNEKEKDQNEYKESSTQSLENNVQCMPEPRHENNSMDIDSQTQNNQDLNKPDNDEHMDAQDTGMNFHFIFYIGFFFYN